MEYLKNKIGQRLHEGLLYQYTSIDGLFGIIDNSKVWATSILHLNDTREYFEGAEIIDKIFKKKKPSRGKYKQFFQEIDQTIQMFTENDVFVASFSEHDDQLSQWRGYTPKNSGYSLGFNFYDERFSAKNTKWDDESGSCMLVKCIYEDAKKHEMAELLVDQFKEQWLADEEQAKVDWSMGKGRIGKSALIFYKYFRSALASSFKNAAFKEEAEWRLIHISPSKEMLRFRKGESSITPYVEIPLLDENPGGLAKIRRIVVGPTPDKDLAMSAVEKFLVSKPNVNIPIVKSSIPFRSW